MNRAVLQALVIITCMAALGCARRTLMDQSPAAFASFTDFAAFTRSESAGATVLVSPEIAGGWDELVLSWNAECPPPARMVFEARAFDGDAWTKYYSLGIWTEGSSRESVKGQRDNIAEVDTDTLKCKRLMTRLQVRITLMGDDASWPVLKFLGVSMLDSKAARPLEGRTNSAAWGKTLPVPERSQLGHAGASGWCSPTTVSMMLAYWAQELKRHELDLTVPAVAAAVHDPNWGGTGNWSFNMAFAGRYQGMRAYATRLDELAQVEDCIAAGVPVALSVSFDLLNGKNQDQANGHLVVVVGFTDAGEVVLNDPWPNPKGENRVRKIVPRERVLRAWQRSKQTAYIVHPENKNPLPDLSRRGL